MSLGWIYDNNGEINAEYVSRVSRTFIPRTAGTLISSKYDPESKLFTATYEAAPNGVTILFLNKKYNYPDGY